MNTDDLAAATFQAIADLHSRSEATRQAMADHRISRDEQADLHEQINIAINHLVAMRQCVDMIAEQSVRKRCRQPLPMIGGPR